MWDIFSFGSDFDCFINSVNAFITADDYKYLAEFLPKAFDENETFRKINNVFDCETVTQKIMFYNVVSFLKRYY